jgi:hypothetical protein
MLPAAIDPTQTHSAQNDGTTSGDQAQQNPAPDTSIKRKRSSESSTSSSAAAAPPASESEDSCTVPAKKSKKKSKKQRKKERKIWKQGIGAMARDTDAPSDEEEEKPASDPKAEEGSDEEGEKTEGAKVKEAKQKKGVFAKEARWDDIPDWKGRGDCPLLDLPAEILDRCFGLTKDLDVSGRLCNFAAAAEGLTKSRCRLVTMSLSLGPASSSGIILPIRSSMYVSARCRGQARHQSRSANRFLGAVLRLQHHQTPAELPLLQSRAGAPFEAGHQPQQVAIQSSRRALASLTHRSAKIPHVPQEEESVVVFHRGAVHQTAVLLRSAR